MPMKEQNSRDKKYSSLMKKHSKIKDKIDGLQGQKKELKEAMVKNKAETREYKSSMNGSGKMKKKGNPHGAAY